MYEMSPRERFLRTMNFEPADRLPIMMNWLTVRYVTALTGLSLDEYWADQIGAHARAFKLLGVDFCEQLAFPPREESDRAWSAGEEAQWADPDAVAADLERHIAAAGRELAARAEEPARREQQVQAICDYQIATQKRLGDDCPWLFGMDEHGPALIGFPYGTYGYEGFFLVVATYPDVMERWWQAGARLARWHNECVVEAARRLDWPRIGYLGEDMTTQNGNMIRPAIMARRYFPHLDHALEPLVRAGFKLVWHSDGNMNDMLDPLIEIGIAGFQGFQEECGTCIADVARRQARNGDPLILWGSVSAIDVVRNGTRADIRREVQRVLDEWPHPGLCLATASAMMDDVPHANITEMYRLFRTLGAVQRGR
jgi:hypothetical protein